tara:strand:- start:2689 stop:3657 length:969 start_codon:yes stop_codon:yes gene_type:complete
METFTSFENVYAHKHAFEKQRKKSERINGILLNAQRHDYFHDKIEMIVALSMHICDDSKMSFLQCSHDMLFEWYHDLVSNYQRAFQGTHESIDDDEDDYIDEEEILYSRPVEEIQTKTEYQLIDQFFHTYKDTIFHSEYKQALGFETFFDLEAHIDQQYYIQSPEALWRSFKQQLFKYKRLYRSMQESYLLEAFYYLQFEAFIHVFHDIYGAFQRCHKTFKKELKKTVQQAIRTIPSYVEAPYQYKDNQTWIQDINNQMDQRNWCNTDISYDLYSEFLNREQHLTKTNYIDMFFRNMAEYNKKPIQSKRTKNVHTFKNITFF